MFFRLSLMVIAMVILSVSMASPALGQTSTSYLTTGLSPSGLVQAIIGGYDGVLANYTSSFPFSFTALVYMDLVNAIGQTVSVSVSSCNFMAQQEVSCFLVLSSSIPSGNYMARTFVTSTSGVPVSVTSSLPIGL